MTDSAQDYTYEVLGMDSNYEVTIRVTSYDSLHGHLFYQAKNGDSDGTITTFVANNFGRVFLDWEEQRQSAPTFTIGTRVTNRYKTIAEGEKPSFNSLTKTLVETVTEDSNEITTSFSLRGLTDSEKGEIYSRLSSPRSDVWLNLLEAGLIDSTSTILGIDDPAGDSAEIEYRHKSGVEFSASSSQSIQSSLGLNDSDFAALFSRD
jgi:hypothetical protein